MNLDNIIQHVQRQAQLLAAEWQDDKRTVIVQQLQNSSSILPSDFGEASQLTFPSIHWQHSEHWCYLPEESFLPLAYRQLLGREIDESGAHHYSQLLKQGMPRSFVVLSLLNSAEAKSTTTTTTSIVGLAKIKPLWYLDKVFKRIPKVGRYLQKLLWSWLAKWEQATFVKYHVIIQQQRQQQRQLKHLYKNLQLFSQQVQNQLATLVMQITTSQTLATENLNHFQNLQHRLNYQQGMLQNLLDELAQPEKDPQTLKQHQQVAQAHSQDLLDAYYVAFEDANRGSREEIGAKLQPYIQRILQHLQAHPHLAQLPALDIGCGRGEWLQLLKEQGITATGVDTNAIMVQACQAQELSVYHADALTWLHAQPDNSHSIITGFHIIEHLPFEVLFHLFAQAYRVLAPQGMIIFETPNPENLLVASHTFYHDFTHRHPITPTAIRFLALYHNFTDIDILRLHPYPESARVPGHDPLTERVNGHLTGPQDFAIIAVKPVVSQEA